MQVGVGLSLALASLPGSTSLAQLLAAGNGFYIPTGGEPPAFQETTGETEAADTDTLALGLDVLQDAGYSGGAFTGLGAELVTNGGFDADSDWTKGTGWTISGGVASIDTPGGFENIYPTVQPDTDAGKFYLVEFDIVSVSGGTISFYFQNTFVADYSSPGSYSLILQPTSETASGTRFTGSASVVGSIDNVSVKELPGYHASQSTAADEPTYDESEGGWDFDGTSDNLNSAPETSWTDITVGTTLKTSDISFMMFGGNSSGTPYALYVSSSDAASGADNTAGSPDYFIDGVQLYNPTSVELHEAISTGAKVHVETRSMDLSDFNSDMHIGCRGNESFFYDGLLYDPYLTDITDSDDLDAIAAAAMTAQGITNRASETAEDVVQDTGDAGLWDTTDSSTLWQDTGATTQADAGQDPVARVDAIAGSANWTQSTAASRPLWDAAEGLLDFDGTDDYLIQDLSGIGDRTDMYFAAVCKIDAADDNGTFLSSANGLNNRWALIYDDGQTGVADFSSGAGTPSYFVDTALQSWSHRDDAHTAICDGSLHFIEITSLDLSISDWDTVAFSALIQYSIYTDGFTMPLYLGPNPGVIERNIIRARALEMFPSLSFA